MKMSNIDAQAEVWTISVESAVTETSKCGPSDEFRVYKDQISPGIAFL
jgi:hypothetical protein